eukprot:2148164-Pleurochrysis_carterae.AAC.3
MCSADGWRRFSASIAKFFDTKEAGAHWLVLGPHASCGGRCSSAVPSLKMLNGSCSFSADPSLWFEVYSAGSWTDQREVIAAHRQPLA